MAYGGGVTVNKTADAKSIRRFPSLGMSLYIISLRSICTVAGAFYFFKKRQRCFGNAASIELIVMHKLVVRAGSGILFRYAVHFDRHR